MKKIYRKSIILGLALIVAYIIFNLMPVQNFIFSLKEFFEPNLTQKLEKEWQEKPDEFLIKKLYANNYYYPGLAADILCRRDKREIIPILIKFSRSNYTTRAKIGIYGLSYFGGKEAEESLIEVIKQGRENKNYLMALDALSIMHYDKIYLEILKMANDNYHTSWVVDMLERFPDKPETLSTLQNIAKNDPEWYIRDKAEEVIEKIKSQQ